MKPEKLHDAMNYLDDDLTEAVDRLRRNPPGRKNVWTRWIATAACFCLIVGGFWAGSALFDGTADDNTLEDAGSGTQQDNGAMEGGNSTSGEEIREDVQQDGDAVPSTEAPATEAPPTEAPATEAPATEAAPETEAADGSTSDAATGAATEAICDSVTMYGVQYIRTDGYVDGAKYPRITVIRSREELDDYYRENCDTYYLERRTKVYADTTIGFLDACDRYDEAYFSRYDLLLVLLEEGSGSIRHEVTGLERHPGEHWMVYLRYHVPEVCTADMAEWHIMIEIEKGLLDRANLIEVTKGDG